MELSWTLTSISLPSIKVDNPAHSFAFYFLSNYAVINMYNEHDLGIITFHSIHILFYEHLQHTLEHNDTQPV